MWRFTGINRDVAVNDNSVRRLTQVLRTTTPQDMPVCSALTGIIMATRAKLLVKGFGYGIVVSAISLGIIDAIFYLRTSAR